MWLKARLQPALVFIVLLSAFGVFTQHLITLWSYTVDDAYIAFRYAYNFVHYGKILWNIGQPPVEGYTSFLDILWLSLGFLTHSPILLWAKFTGILCVLGVGLIMLRTANITQKALFSLTLAFLYVFFLSDLITAIHVVAGLETPLYFLLLFSTARLFSSINNPDLPDTLFLNHVRLFSLFALLLGLTRPEANLYNLIFLIGSCCYLQENRLRYFIKTTLLLYIAPGLIYYLWRTHYYGLFFPLSFYIKFYNGSLFQGSAATLHFLHYYWPLLLVMIVFWKNAFKTQKIIVLTYAAVFLSGLLFSLHADPIMNYSFRFAWPMIALVLASSCLQKDLPEKKQKIAVVILIIAIAVFVYKNHTETLTQLHADSVYTTGMEKTHIPLGKALGTIQSENFLVTCDAGAIPFYSHWPVIDSCALNNKILATTPLSPSQQADYIFSQNPRVIILISNSDRALSWPVLPFEQLLYEQAIKANMQVFKIIPFQPGYNLWVMGYPNDKTVISALQ